MAKWPILVVLLAVLGFATWNMTKTINSVPGTVQSVSSETPLEQAHPTDGTDEVSTSIADNKARLQANPLDVEALNALYQVYAEIGQAEEMYPSTRSAVEAWKAGAAAGEGEIKVLAGVAMAAMQYGDLQGAVLAMETYHEAQPENLSVISAVGNLYFQLSRLETTAPATATQHAQSAVDWYAKYLAATTAENQGEAYWNVMVDQASMQVQLADSNAQSPEFKQAMDQLLQVTVSAPDNWSGWHNYGITLGLAGQKDQAITTLKQAMQVAGNKMERWESEKQIAMLEGRELPPPPFDMADPHADVDMKGFDLPKAAPGSPNPHGESTSSGAAKGIDG